MSGKAYTLMRAKGRDRRHLLRGAVAAAGAAVLSGCDRLSNNASFVATLQSAEKLSHAAGRIVAPKAAMAQEFSPKRRRAGVSRQRHARARATPTTRRCARTASPPTG